MKTKEKKNLKELEEIERKILKNGKIICKVFAIDPELLIFLKYGKKLRAKLLILSKNIKSKKKRIKIGALIELLHTASLVHDDIIDENTLRRGFPTINALFNDKYAISVGYAFFSHIFMNLLSLDRDILLSFFETIKDMCTGEIFEIKGAFNKEREENDYIEVVKLKTGSLFALSCSVNEKRRDKELKDFGENFGIAFQILDDISDLVVDKDSVGKETLKDLKGGIYTLPVIYYFSEVDKLKESFTKETINKSKNKALEYLAIAKKKTKNKELLKEVELLEKKILTIFS